MNKLDMLVYILSLDKRKELYTELAEQARQHIGQNVHTFVVGDGKTLPANEYDHTNYCEGNLDTSKWGYGREETKWLHWNALLSQKMIVGLARKARAPYFLMLEDDAYFTSRFDEAWTQIDEKILLENDLCYLGWWQQNEFDEWNAKIESDWETDKTIKILPVEQPLGGFHGVVVNSRMYDLILKLPMVNPLDSQLNSYGIHQKYKSKFICPKIIGVKSVMSNLEGSVLERKQI